MWDEVGLSKDTDTLGTPSSNCYDIPFIGRFMEKRAIFQYIPFCPSYKEGICFKRCPTFKRTSELDISRAESKQADENGLGKDNYGLEVSSV